MNGKLKLPQNDWGGAQNGGGIFESNGSEEGGDSDGVHDIA